jgi:hypothetical protein
VSLCRAVLAVVMANIATLVLPNQLSGRLQDALFAKVAEILPSVREDDDDEEFDIAAIMAKQQQQAAKIRQEAQQMREAAGCGS